MHRNHKQFKELKNRYLKQKETIHCVDNAYRRVVSGVRMSIFDCKEQYRLRVAVKSDRFFTQEGKNCTHILIILLANSEKCGGAKGREGNSISSVRENEIEWFTTL